MKIPEPATETDKQYLPAIRNWVNFCKQIGADPQKILWIVADPSTGRSLSYYFDSGRYRELYYYKEVIPYGNEMVWTAVDVEEERREKVSSNPFGNLGSANLNKTLSELERTRTNLKTLRGELPTTSESYAIIDEAVAALDQLIQETKNKIWEASIEKGGK